MTHTLKTAPEQSIQSLKSGARAIVAATDPSEKASLAYEVAQKWFSGGLGLHRSALDKDMPNRPGRPDKPVLLPPRDMPKRAMGGKAGKLALLHSLAHIELNAIDLTWDLLGRFCRVPMPRSFFDDWVQVGLEEAKHFTMLEKHLASIGASYGDLPAHDGLWQAAQSTEHDLLARLAIIPLVLEARGLDITPPMIEKARSSGDPETARVLEVIYRDEKRHVAFGAKWFRFMCDRERIKPEPKFHELVREHFKGPLKPPFNDRARSEAGLTPGFYRPLIRLTG
ncbi:ferritin-like domain-containing protein [Pseudovibrio exalbescens]|uniref:ferritin-like domain-containing protein n=1 Tax=Pseudovibrio exalbescens TaxID=197461 RepID=UPI002365D676|nr:ferritin-like domain-containing protein [Pseudovibrio exalbescens]MDD7908484.1 ferritin-like domain-containing protein [Pseudovibrio exalbescens]